MVIAGDAIGRVKSWRRDISDASRADIPEEFKCCEPVMYHKASGGAFRRVYVLSRNEHGYTAPSFA